MQRWSGHYSGSDPVQGKWSMGSAIAHVNDACGQFLLVTKEAIYYLGPQHKNRMWENGNT